MTPIAYTSKRSPRSLALKAQGGFTLLEVIFATAILVIAFSGLFATVLQAGRVASAAEEEALVETGLEQRIDQLRLLEWPDLTSATGIKTKIWTARPDALAGMTVTQETLTLSPSDLSGAQTLSCTWNGTSAPTTSVSAGPALNVSTSIKVVATLSWRSARSGKIQMRSVVTVISRGGLSKSDRL